MNRLEQMEILFSEYILKLKNRQLEENGGTAKEKIGPSEERAGVGLYMSTTNGFFDPDRYEEDDNIWYDKYIRNSKLYKAQY